MKLIFFYGLFALFAVLFCGIAKSSADNSFDEFNKTHLYCQKVNNISDEEFSKLVTVLREIEDEYESENKNESVTEDGDDDGDEGDDGDDSDDITSDELEDFDMKFKCYALCLLEESEVLGDDDKLDLELLEKFGDISDSSKEIIKECKLTHDPEQNACEYGFSILACIGVSFMARNQEKLNN